MKIVIPSLVSLALCGVAGFGCSEKAKDAPKDAPAPAGEAADMDADTTDVPEGLKGLDPADLALVRAQKTCPVSGEPLGSMGAPIRKEVDGKVVFLCCKSCTKKFDADPQKYAAMVESG